VRKKVLMQATVLLGVAGSLMMAVPAHAGADTTSGIGGVLAGNQVIVPIVAPVDACGISAGVIGAAISGCKGGAWGAILD
jgi:hypothetical protein